jgi:hypothetical protein
MPFYKLRRILRKGVNEMTHDTEPKTKNLRELEDVIARAIKKVGAKRETDLCRYIAMPGGGYMHHFTWRKNRSKYPRELGTQIETSILHADRPSRIAPKKRAPRGSRKRRNPFNFTHDQLGKLLKVARQTGEKEIIAMLSPQLPFDKCKKELISSIKHNRIEAELWVAYCEAIAAQQMVQSK